MLGHRHHGDRRRALRAMLMSPNFMFLTELGEPIAGSPGKAELNQYEIASAISYTLTQGPADEPLWSSRRTRS